METKSFWMKKKHIILQSEIKKQTNKQTKHFCYKKGRFSYRLLFQKYNKKKTQSPPHGQSMANELIVHTVVR